MKELSNHPITIALADDHQLFRSGLINLIHSFGTNYKVVTEASNGKELLLKLESAPLPDLVLIDLNMPVMDGFETSLQLQKKYPNLKVLMISMVDDEKTMIKMMKSGIRGYLSKDIEPEELKTALDITYSKGFYYTDQLTGKLINALQDNSVNGGLPLLTEREKQFLDFACSELTYKEIADKMFLSIKTIDGYRNDLFEKLDVKSRVGLVLYAIKNEMVKL